MEIFTNEFKDLLSKQLEELTNVVKTDGAEVISDYEVAKLVDVCMNNTDCGKKEKNKKFKLDDIVYLGNLQGKVNEIDNNLFLVFVIFNNGYRQWFTNDGRLFQNSPKVLSHFPYKLKIKKNK